MEGGEGSGPYLCAQTDTCPDLRVLMIINFSPLSDQCSILSPPARPHPAYNGPTLNSSLSLHCCSCRHPTAACLLRSRSCVCKQSHMFNKASVFLLKMKKKQKKKNGLTLKSLDFLTACSLTFTVLHSCISLKRKG